LNKKTGNSFAEPFLFSSFSNILIKNAGRSHWPDLMKDEAEQQPSGICFLAQKKTVCLFRIRRISLNDVMFQEGYEDLR